MDFWMMWDATKTKTKDIIKFIHVSFLARIYYNFLNNLYVLLCLAIFGSLTYYYIGNKIEKLNSEKEKRDQISLNLTSNFIENKLSKYSKLKEEAINFGITDKELIISLGIIANLIDEKNTFKIEDFDLEIELISRESKKIGIHFPTIISFKNLFQLKLNGDDLYRYVTFLNQKGIKDDLGLIKDMTNYLLKEKNIEYKAFLKENNF